MTFVNDINLFTQIEDSIVTGSLPEQLPLLIKVNSDRILKHKYSNGLTAIHLAVLYKRENLLKLLLSLEHSDANCKVEFGLTPLHFVLSKPQRFTTLLSYYNKLNIYPTLGERRMVVSLIKLLVDYGSARLLRCEHNFSVLSLAVITKMDIVKNTIMHYFDLEVNNLFDYFNILAYTIIDPKCIHTLINVCRKRIAFLVKQGLPIDYTLVEIDYSWILLWEKIQSCFTVDHSLDILKGVNFRLLCLHKSIDIRNEGLFGEVAQRFIYGYSSVMKDIPVLLKKYDLSIISRSLYLNIILSLESTLLPTSFSFNTQRVSWTNDLNGDLWQSHCKLWQSVFDHLNILWQHDPGKFDITPIVDTLFKFFDERLVYIFKPNFLFASDAKVPARISFNFLCVYTTLFLYLSKEFSTYYKSNSYDRFYRYLQIIIHSSRSKTYLINLLIHPVNYERTFEKYNVSMTDAISFLLLYNLDVNHRSIIDGKTFLHEVTHQSINPLPLVKFLLSVGVYPFSLDSEGNLFYHYFSESDQNEIVKLPSLQRPYPLQTLCCKFLVGESENVENFRTLLPPPVYTFLKLHTKFTDV
ncbi:hypothetical protein LOD99_2441 [Oopsacas minuta]|uniref:Uncharacterized protein n=1 Tax=Oopsacas minuta TaxID=111878 RepID=A0AAV7K1V4_9METZ|nr:hypothetical protein LOD99_2441 [Oopsacas minuta]